MKSPIGFTPSVTVTTRRGCAAPERPSGSVGRRRRGCPQVSGRHDACARHHLRRLHRPAGRVDEQAVGSQRHLRLRDGADRVDPVQPQHAHDRPVPEDRPHDGRPGARSRVQQRHSGAAGVVHPAGLGRTEGGHLPGPGETLDLARGSERERGQARGDNARADEQRAARERDEGRACQHRDADEHELPAGALAAEAQQRQRRERVVQPLGHGEAVGRDRRDERHRAGREHDRDRPCAWSAAPEPDAQAEEEGR